MAVDQSGKPTLVLGIGNLFRKDDGVGIHVIRRLESVGLPESVRLLDGGTAGLDLVLYLEGIDRLIIVDAFETFGMPGDVRIVNAAEYCTDRSPSIHSGSLGDILDMASALWKRPETIIIGIIPADCEGFGENLSPELVPAVDKVTDMILEMV